MKLFTHLFFNGLLLLILLPAKVFTQNITLTTSPVAAANIAQSTTNNIVYAVKMEVTTLPVTVNSIQFTLRGTHDNNDLTTINLFFNASAPTLTGATQMGSASALFAGPQAYNLPFNFTGNQSIAAGGSGYFIIAVNVNAAATNGNTIKVNGLADPITFGYTTAPTLTNNQTDIAGTQTILAAGVTLNTSAIAAANIAQGSTNNIVYAVKMDVTSLPVLVNSIQFNLIGTHDNNDLTTINLFFNATAPSLTGASQMGTASALFAGPHAYNLPFNFTGNQSIAAGGSGYFIIAVNVNAAATNGNTIKVNALADPITFGYTTAPTLTNNQTDIAGTQTILSAGVTLTSSAIAAANIAQGSTNNIIYAVKMDVTSLPVTVNSMQFILSGTHDINDLTTINLFFNATAPSLTGASQMGSASALFAGPHAYNLPFNFTGNQSIAAGGSGYFIIAVNLNGAATGGNTVKVNGLTDPLTFGYTTSPTITNSQTDIAGIQTIFAAGVTLTSSAIAAANIAQGSTDNIVYAVKMDVASLPVTVNSIQLTLTGTHDNNDLITINLFFNATTPSLNGASQMGSASALFAGPHAYNLPFNFTGNQFIAAGGSGYFIIAVNLNGAATGGNTVKVNGLTDPLTFGYTTSPTITNSQTDIAGIKTIFAAGVTLTSSAIAAANIAQGSTDNIVYAVKMDVASFPATINSMQFTLTGTHDNNDLTTINLFFNATAPSLTGATQLEIGASALFAAPHTYNLTFNIVGNKTIAAGASGYFMIVVNLNGAATGGNTVKVNGLTDPVTFGYTTAPTITNNQTDIAGIQTILAAGVTLTTSAIAAANIAQGSFNDIVYAVRMDVASLPVTVNSIQFTLTGTHDNNDLTVLHVYYNATAPTVTGASFMAINISATFAAPHTYNLAFNAAGTQIIAAGASGYFIIVVNINAAATSGNTIKVNGAANPITFGYTTSPGISNNQTDIADTQTILAAGVTLTTSAIAAANIAEGTINNVVYALRMDVTSSPVVVNSIQFTLTGTHDNNDLIVLNVYYNGTAPTVTGASFMASNIPATFTAPHLYNLAFNVAGTQAVAAGTSGYFIIVVNTATAATPGNTIKLDGEVNPVIFGFTTSPPVTNNQSDAAGAQTITTVLPLTLINFAGNVMGTQAVRLEWITAGEFNTKEFEIELSGNGLQFDKIATIPAGNSAQERHYSYLHKQPVDGNNFYRLKMNDKDGRFTYSPVIKIKIAVTETKIAVFPNPVTNFLNLQVQAVKNETMVFNLHCLDGKVIASKTFIVFKGNNRISWNLQQLAPGNYFIFSGNKLFEPIKIIKN